MGTFWLNCTRSDNCIVPCCAPVTYLVEYYEEFAFRDRSAASKIFSYVGVCVGENKKKVNENGNFFMGNSLFSKSQGGTPRPKSKNLTFFFQKEGDSP